MAFGRRSQSNPPAKTPPTAAAATAAAQAFLANRASNANLSNAAAAAALRSHTTTPTPVGDVQTKRMIQRRTSTSSHGSAAGNVQRPGLQRQDSSGSMTERTFREPSPNRSSSARTRGDEPPPMPPMPREYASPPPLPAKSNRRPASVESPERVLSPPPKLMGGRGVSLDRGPGVMARRPNNQARQRNVSLGAFAENEQDSNRGSVNFSRPMSPLATPPVSPLRETQPSFSPSNPGSATKKASITSALSNNERENIQYQLQQTASSPVKKKKKSTVSSITQGSHLANGGAGGRPTGSALNVTPNRQTTSVSSTPSPSNMSSQSNVATEPNETIPKKKKKKRNVADSNAHEPQSTSYASDSDTFSEQSMSSERPRTFNTRAAGLLTKQPSIVREDREAEEIEERQTTAKRSGSKPSQNGNAGVKIPNMEDVGQSIEDKPQNLPKTDTKPMVTIDTLTPQAASAQRPVSNNGGTNESRGKRDSLSPARAAHFSSGPFYATPDGTKHQPPPRSVSPAKSAMKNSPSSRGASPAGVPPGAAGLIPGYAPSEASDTTSVMSDEGYRSQPKKKRNVRVSFEDDPTIVGRGVSPPNSPQSPVMFSPQVKDASRKGRLGLGRDIDTAVGVEDDTIKPMPALPSFGSVRGRQEQDNISETLQQHAPMANHEYIGRSSDHAIGGILAQDRMAKANGSLAHDSNKALINDPVPPEVTSVEGNGYHSGTDLNLSDDDGMGDKSRQVGEVDSSNFTGTSYPNHSNENRGTRDTTSASSSEIHGDTVPSIAIQPATPGIEDSSQTAVEQWLGMPGGFPTSTEFLDRAEAGPNPVVEHHATDLTPADVGIAEPQPESSPASQTSSPLLAGEVAETLRQQSQVHDDDASDVTDDSIYSDAAEDLSDIEGDGFGSINAIMESPITVIPQAVKPELHESSEEQDESPGAAHHSETLEPRSDEGWGKAQAYWSGLSQSRKQQLEQVASQTSKVAPASRQTIETTAEPTLESKPKPKKKKSIPKSESDAAAQDGFLVSKKKGQQQQISEATVSSYAFKKSMRESLSTSQDAPQFRSSMRNPPSSNSDGPHMRSSMRSGALSNSSLRETKSRSTIISSGSPESKVSLQKKQRPVSAVAMIDYNKSANGTTNLQNRVTSGSSPLKSLTPVAAQPGIKPMPVKSSLRRKTSDGSDSSSSFRKARPTSTDAGRYTMRRSMRSSSVDERPKSFHASQLSGSDPRPTSPVGSSSRRPFSSSGPSMRTSMRDPVESSISRPSKSPNRSLGFGKGSKPKSKSTKPSSRFSSRFGDSSDEEGGPKAFGSRFADSSDEDEPGKMPTNLTPIRGIPRRIDEGDSTDLEDSSEETPAPIEATTPSSIKPTSSEGAALATGSLRGNGHSRQVSKSSELGNGFDPRGAGEKEKKKRSFFGSLGRRREDPVTTNGNIDNDPRWDLPTTQNKALQVTTPGSPAQASPKSPKLQRRNTPKRFQSFQSQADVDSWPLPQSPATTNNTGSRPNTSDGAVVRREATSRPGPGARRSTLENGGNGVVLGKAGKKKRFPLLRRAFGLHD